MSFDFVYEGPETSESTLYPFFGRAHGTGRIRSAMPGLRARKNSVPGPYFIYLFPRSGTPLKHLYITRADANGNWEVQNLNQNLQFMVMVFDTDRGTSSAVVDWVTPEPIE